MSKRARRVDPELSAKRAAAGRKGAAARWGLNSVTTDGNEQAQRAAAGDGNGSWFRIVNAARGGVAEVYIYDEIGYWGTTAQDFVDELRELEADKIELHINSPGGNVFDGLAIYNALLDHAAVVHTMVDGLAASAASFIAQAGDRVTMAANSQLMIHDAFGVCVGTADDMEQMRDLLEFQSRNIASLYAARSGEGTTADWRDAMRAETWYSAQEAVDAGLADDVAPKAQGKRSGTTDTEDRFDLAVFNYEGRADAPAPTIRPATRHAPAVGDIIPVSGPGADAEVAPGDGRGEPGPAGDAAADGTLDPFADLDDDALAGVGAALDRGLSDDVELDYDPDDLAALIVDAFSHAPAPTPSAPAPPPPLDHISVNEFATALQEALL